MNRYLPGPALTGLQEVATGSSVWAALHNSYWRAHLEEKRWGSVRAEIVATTPTEILKRFLFGAFVLRRMSTCSGRVVTCGEV